MERQLFLVSSLLLSFYASSSQSNTQLILISKIEMHLSAFGVESDDFPSIDGYIDFTNESSNCTKSYYSPDLKGSVYQISREEIKKALELLQKKDLDKLKKEYSVNKSDQPTSTLIIYTNKGSHTIKDYGLEGDYPLPELYKLIYKFSFQLCILFLRD